MFTSEDGAGKIIDEAVEKYELHFNELFPLYEYIDTTSDDEFDFSVKGAKELSGFIDERIKANEPVEIPDGYEERLY